jgi:acetylornithine deacetylase/succinyl-diaminopimelate desuccinylase-like protein
LVIADLANYDTGLPSLTTSLRGNIVVELELQALKSPLHSGMWGGAVGDVCSALSRMLASLSQADGTVIPALRAGCLPPTPEEIASWQRLPFEAKRFAEQAGVAAEHMEADPVRLHQRLWREPSLAINAIEAGIRGQTGNVLMDSVWARLSLRLAPGQDPKKISTALREHVQQQTPAWCSLKLTERGSPGCAWSTNTEHPAFQAGCRALRDGFGVDPVLIGCGASIPFVGEATAALGGVPALLLGVEDPACAAHAENESVHLDDLRKAFRSAVALIGYMV